MISARLVMVELRLGDRTGCLGCRFVHKVWQDKRQTKVAGYHCLAFQEDLPLAQDVRLAACVAAEGCGEKDLTRKTG